MAKNTKHQQQEGLNDDVELVIPEEELPSCCNSCCGHNCWWEPPSSEEGPSCENKCLTMGFCRASNIHGLKYIGLVQGHIVERIVWTIFFIAALVASVYLIRETVTKYIYSPVTVTFTEEAIPVEDIPFPAVTICNVNNLRRSQVDQLSWNAMAGDRQGLSEEDMQKAYDDMTFVQHVCDATSISFSAKFDLGSWRRKAEKLSHQFKEQRNASAKVVPFLQEFAQKCPDMIKLCRWQSQKYLTCKDLFHEVITDYGKCCVFNMAPESLLVRNPRIRDHEDLVKKWSQGDFDTDSLILTEEQHKVKKNIPEYPKRARSSGLSNGISIVIDPDLNEYYCAAANSVGFQLAIHLPIEFPQIAEYGDAIPVSTESYIKIRPDVTKADDDMRSLSEEVRNCYFTGEFTLAYFKKYTRQNCFDECYANLTFSKCNCTRFYMPQDPARDLCTHDQINCTMELDSYYQDHQDELDENCGKCRITCNYINYVAEITSKPIRNDVNIWDYAPGVKTKLWGNKNLSIIHLYFADDTTYPKVRKRLLGITDLLASIGSLLGLTIGFSALSLFEFLYFILKKVIGWLLRLLKVRQWCDEDCCCFCCGETDSQDEYEVDEEEPTVHARRRKSFGRRHSQSASQTLPLRVSAPIQVQNQQNMAWNNYHRGELVPRNDSYY